jgi:hypothetical protein
MGNVSTERRECRSVRRGFACDRQTDALRKFRHMTSDDERQCERADGCRYITYPDGHYPYRKRQNSKSSAKQVKRPHDDPAIGKIGQRDKNGIY